MRIICFPHFQVPGNDGLAGGIQLQARHQQQQFGVGPEHRPGWTRGNIPSPERVVKTRQAMSLGQVRHLGWRHTGKCVEVGSQPAIVLCQQATHELLRRVRTRPRQFPPGGFCSRSSGHHHSSVADGDVTAVKIKHRRESKQLRYSRKLPQRRGRLGVHTSHGPVETSQHGIVQQRVNYIVPTRVCRTASNRSARTTGVPEKRRRDRQKACRPAGFPQARPKETRNRWSETLFPHRRFPATRLFRILASAGSPGSPEVGPPGRNQKLESRRLGWPA